MLFPTPRPPAQPRRVVVTGAGIVTALGIGWSANAEGFRSGRCAIRPVTLFDVTRQRTGRAAEVDLPGRLPRSRLTPRQESRLDRASRMLLLAALEAWQQAGWTPDGDPIPQVLGTTSAGMMLGEDFYRQATAPKPDRRQQATRVTHYQPQRQALDLADALGIEGPALVIANACASGANAIGHGFEQVRSGRASRVLAGGYDALSQLVFAGFDALQALSPTSCRPFAAGRDGLALGEGAAMVCLESLDAARARGAMILGEVAGYGAATDVHHLTQPHPEGLAALASMNAACRQAGITARDVDYLNAHGTGTPLNDAAEAAAIASWAGDAVGAVRVSSTKASIGHLLGAAGAVEAVVCLMALQGGWLPPQWEAGPLDPACHFPVVQAPEDRAVRCVLTNSFGFGGANASMVLRR
ncbi:MAG: beta-ketoacyl-[acyl-carrier-protein] synthase family protein [Verrucomicrobia bacterium]|nr:beta-ketoacyl-[acyl-carrier-protein] synthase family protein [Verrucomicrobiota bacterium]